MRKEPGELILLYYLPKGNNGDAIYKCYCGKEFRSNPYYIKAGRTRSCGCYHKQGLHYTDNRSKTRLYKLYRGILQRTTNPNNPDYYKYGGRGIKICAEWLEFDVFREWANANGYSDRLTIDRIDNDKGYSPDNCRWASIKEQTRNKPKSRKPKTSKYKGVHYCRTGRGRKRWRAKIMVDYKRISLGRYFTEVEAAIAYNNAAIEYFGEFAHLNVIDTE